jgi:hypothetical protein
MTSLDVPAFLLGDQVLVKERAGLILRRLLPADFDRLLRFRADIVAAVGNPEVSRLMLDEATFVSDALDPRNFAIGLFDNDRMVAQNSQFWPSDEDDLRSLGIYEYVRRRASASQITFAGGVMVDPRLRGSGLQKFLIEVRQIVASHVSREHHISTVSFANHFSWRNIMESGGRIIAIYEFEDPRFGQTRRMFMHASPAAKPLSEDKIWLDPTDIEAQRTLLAEGMVGTTFRNAATGLEIAYQRELD